MIRKQVVCSLKETVKLQTADAEICSILIEAFDPSDVLSF